MAIGDRVPKRLAQSALSATLAGIYTVPANSRAQITQMWLANTDSQNDKDVFFGDGTLATNVLSPKVTVPKSSTVTIDASKIVLSPSGVFAAKQSLKTTGTAQAGSTVSTIVLAAGANATNSYYNGQVIVITSGLGSGQSRIITAYVGGTKVATIDVNWTTTPDATSVYSVGDVFMTVYGVEEVIS